VVEPTHTISHQVEGPGVVRVFVSGEFDMDNSDDLAAALNDIIADPAVERLIVDLGGTTFMDSSGIRAFMQAHHAATCASKRFHVVNWRTSVRRVFELLGLAEAFERSPDGLE
jgi:anti-anti-sigma factor